MAFRQPPEQRFDDPGERRARRLGEAALKLAQARSRLNYWRQRPAMKLTDVEEALFALANTAHERAQLEYSQAAKDISLDDIEQAVKFLQGPAND